MQFSTHTYVGSPRHVVVSACILSLISGTYACPKGKKLRTCTYHFHMSKYQFQSKFVEASRGKIVKVEYKIVKVEYKFVEVELKFVEVEVEIRRSGS